MGNFVLLKDSYYSLTFDSYDLIPPVETVYKKQKSFSSQVFEGKNEYQTHKIYLLNDKVLIQVFIFKYL